MRCKLHEYAICFRGERYLSVRAASIATLSTWTYLMNKMSRRARAISWRAINCKAYVAKWEETKLRIRLMKNETRSHTHILTYIVHCLFFCFFSPRILQVAAAVILARPWWAQPWHSRVEGGRWPRGADSSVTGTERTHRSQVFPSATSGFRIHYYSISVWSMDEADTMVNVCNIILIFSVHVVLRLIWWNFDCECLVIFTLLHKVQR